MANKFGRDVVQRYDQNPILTVDDIPFPCNTVFNAAATRLGDETILLLRVENLQGHSILVVARGTDGYHFTVDEEPFMTPSRDEPFATYERKGVEDPRITFLEGTYYIVYTAASGYGARLALAKTDDFRSVERVGLISEPDNKDGTLFSRKVGGRYARFDRPMVGDTGNIWISYSDDLLHWGDSHVALPVRGDCWDSWRVGASAQPIETRAGWLEIYHGVKSTSAGPIYRLGAAMFDKDDLTHLLCRSSIPILTPREYYERIGDVGNVVFSCGAIMEDGEDERITIYYGAADTSICIGTVRVDELLQWCAIGE